MSVDNYLEQLKEIENKYNEYRRDLENIIEKILPVIDHTVITKGQIANPTPFYYERMGSKLNGKVLQEPVISDFCMKYHYDSEDRIIMVEEYSVFLKKFEITEIYFYDELTERLLLSSGRLAVLSVFDHAFSNTHLYLAFAGRNGYIVEEYEYEGDVLNQIKISRAKQTEVHRFIYENKNLIQIERICPNGYKELRYTTKKPNFNKIKEDTYYSLRNLILNYEGDFVAVGIEGFIDQQQPMFCVCFTNDTQPKNLIADWNVEMHDIRVYDWQLNNSQEKKCVKIIAEIIAELVDEGVLNGKQIYFHQNQICVTQLYSGAKSVFKKSNIIVK